MDLRSFAFHLFKKFVDAFKKTIFFLGPPHPRLGKTFSSRTRNIPRGGIAFLSLQFCHSLTLARFFFLSNYASSIWTSNRFTAYIHHTSFPTNHIIIDCLSFVFCTTTVIIIFMGPAAPAYISPFCLSIPQHPRIFYT
jgi:hypothetical protein